MTLKEELLTFGQKWDRAIVNNDVAEIAEFMSDDWTIIGTEGGITTKQAFLDWIRSGDVTHNRMDSDETHIQIYGNTGIVTSRGKSAGIYLGKPFTLYEWSLSVFIRNKKEWKCVATMLTPAKVI